MLEKINTFIQSHVRILTLASGILFVCICITLVLTNIYISKTTHIVKGEEYTLKNSITEIPVEDVPTNISFENIPDESFLPPPEGKLIRINLVTMQLVRYEKGKLLGEPIQIIAKAKVGSFWETPGGTYPITNKEEDYFSEKAGATLPYTMHLFGNYMIHGIPHDNKNRDLKNLTTGGIRLSNDDAKELFLWSNDETRVSIFSDSKLKPEPISSASVYVTEGGITMPKVTAESYIVADLDTGEIILQKNKDAVYPIASVSKLMTALVSIETMNQFEFAKVSKKATSVYSVNKFAPGEKIALSNLIYPLLLPSSNVAAEVIAEHSGRESFMIKMNDQAKKLGMQSTVYEDPSGLSNHNVSTAHDLFLLTQHIFKQKPFLFEITLRRSYSAQGHAWGNISQFLNVPGYLGGKSGQTDQAKQSNVALFSLPLSEVANRNIAIIVLRSNDRKTDTMKILSYVKSRVVYGSPKNFTITSSKDLTRDITVSFVGDIMLDRGVRFSVKNNFDGDYSHLFDHAGMLKESDITFANLEGPVSDKGTDLHNLYSFRMEPQVLDVMKAAGFDIVSFANNHVGDWGKVAFDDTLLRLTNAGIKFTGAEKTKKIAEQPVVFEIKGMKIGFIGFSDVGPNQFEATDTDSGILLLNDPRFVEIVKNAKKQVDALVVSIHWGTEYQGHTKRQTEFAHKAVDAGANLIIGHHPHVIQAVETYKGAVIAYSLGNYIFDQGFSKETLEGLILKVTFDATDKNIKRYDRYLSKISTEFQSQEPELAK